MNLGSLRGKTRRSSAFVALTILCWTALLVISPGGRSTAQVASNIGLIFAAFVGATAAMVRSARSAAERRAWVLLGLGALSWGLGQSVWSVYEWLGRDVPFPSYSDVGYLATVPLLVAGLLKLPGTPVSLAERLRLVLDGLLIGVGLLIISWELVIHALVGPGGDGWWKETIALAYPVGDVVIGSIAVVILARARNAERVPLSTLILLTLGAVSFSVGDSGFAILTAQNSYKSGQLIDLGWFAGWMLLALAAMRPSYPAFGTTGISEQRRRAWASMSAPYVPVLCAVAVAGERRVVTGHFAGVTATGLLAMIVLIIARHMLTQRENDVLTRSLEARVRERTSALSGWERWWRALVQNSTDVVTVVDSRGRVEYQTPSVTSVFGYPQLELDGCALGSIFDAAHARRFHSCLKAAARAPGVPMRFTGKVRHADGRFRAGESTVMSLLDDPNVQGLVVNTRDVSEQTQLELELNRRAFHDSLSGLANRALFHDRLAHSVLQREPTATPLAVLFIDLDRFKEVNDALGHAYGDELLVEVARRLTDVVRPGDTVARLGGDEFGVLLERMTDLAEADEVAQRLVDAIGEPMRLSEGNDVQVGASIGIATAGDDDFYGLDAGAAAEMLLRNADLAMYQAKTRGGGLWQRYHPGLLVSLLHRVEIEKELRAAVRDNELHLVFQPTVSLANGSVTGVEALLRWDSTTWGLVMPAEFIPITEKTGLINELGSWVLHEACREAAAWLRRGTRADLTMAVNVSGIQLLSAGIIEAVRSALALSQLPAQNLVLEMTESVLLDHTEEMLARLCDLKALGVRLAIDDFGTGYSSLSYLSRFPVDVLKVDQSFIAQLQKATAGYELTRAIVQLGESLNMITVAEGVETDAQLKALRHIGCDQAQGFLFSRPVSATGIAAMLPDQGLDVSTKPCPDGFSSAGLIPTRR
jgi:diguanylate cyclase (GGDEF)-like protein/PAS domain S-box-containing protein